MKFILLAKLFEKIEGISSRNEMSAVLAEFLKKCNTQEIQILSYMILGRLAPMFVKAEFNYSEKSLINLLTEYTKEDIQKERDELGDIGDTVAKVLSKYPSKSSSVSLKELYEILWKIVNSSGTGSIQVKNKIVLECLQKLSPLESKYFVRIICGQLRLGMNVRSLLDVYSIALVGDKGLKKILEHAYGVCADVGYIAGTGFKSSNPREELSKIGIVLGTPIQSRLVERVGSFSEVVERFKGNIVLQPKFDGLRCQIHKWDKDSGKSQEDISIWRSYYQKEETVAGLFTPKEEFNTEVRLFTRNLEDVTEMFPEIVDAARDMPESSFIFDSEIVGWDYKKDSFMSYQETMQRRRKYSVVDKMVEIPVKAFTFDILSLDGESLITRDTKERLDSLKRILGDTKGGIELAESKEVSTEGEIKDYFDECVGQGLEGIIVKQEQGGYKPGVRNYEWVKLKKSMERDLIDTVDMVIVGYYYGSGRRADLGLGAILAAVLNKKKGTYDAICKVGTGMGDELLKDMSKKLEKLKLKSIPKNIRTLDSLAPDVWVEPKYVITVDADEITKNISNKGKTLVGAGLSLRFPRLIEFDRDKLVEDITTVAELESMYEIRNSKK
ncbi:MAG: ATP-dependent DNA ligase [Candidatus Dojkabacteria bacterium]|jgi:DNA ligase-1|nr:ATP-dependent DNA ligase [Candidatus Dojkabacteria bacterium]